MLEGLRQAGEKGQIQDSQGVNVEVLNAPYRLLSGSEGYLYAARTPALLDFGSNRGNPCAERVQN
jgi:hypothetical protein